MQKKIIIFIVFVMSITATLFLVAMPSSIVGQNKSSIAADYLTNGQASTTRFYASAQLKSHNTEASCYTLISGKIYDVTMYISVHPGGKNNILKICGSDGTQLFTDKHASDTKPNMILRQMQVGVFSYE